MKLNQKGVFFSVYLYRNDRIRTTKYVAVVASAAAAVVVT